MDALIKKLASTHGLSAQELAQLIDGRNEASAHFLAKTASNVRQRYFGKSVYVRGLIEFTNRCKNNCLYCGIRCGNSHVVRYRLTQEEIMDRCRTGYLLGYRTFVLQGGEDPWYSPEKIELVVRSIKTQYPDCAVTLSVGEHSREVYQSWFDAGADRYLLRHETADRNHYEYLHPKEMSFVNRMRCLKDLKEIGYQTGCGFMVGSPGQTTEHLVNDLLFLKEFQPHMVGIGPFIPQKDTPFGKETAGTLELTVYLLSIIRLLLPDVLLPATTALGTIHPQGRELGILAGANVCMPNLSPAEVRKNYALYDNKLCTGDEAADGIQNLKERMERIGYQITMSRGDHPSKGSKEYV